MKQRASKTGRTVRATAAMAALLVIGACGSDNGTGTDNTPASITANVTVPASAVIASPVNPAPSVIVKNASGNPLPNVRVTFTITSGGGAIEGPSQLTDASGVATVESWTLGDTPGVQTLSATAGGNTVTFTIQATNECNITGAIAAGQTVNGDLRTSTCPFGDGTAVQSWSFEQASGQSAVSFAMHATGAPTFNTFLVLHRTAFSGFDRALAVNDDDAGSLTDSRMNVILGPGSYVVSANNFEPGVTGPFSLTAESWTGELQSCEDVYVTPGITSSQTMTSECGNQSTGQYADVVGLYLNQGEQVQIDMVSAAFDPQLELYAATSGTLVLRDDNGGGGTSARITYTASSDDLYIIVLTSPNAGRTGAYTLSVAQLAAAPSGPAQSALRPAAAPRASWMSKSNAPFARISAELTRTR
jgi:Big-like domain-containing protein